MSQVVRRPASWRQASDDCRAENTSLPYVGDVFDNAQLMKLLYSEGGEQYWLALSDSEVSVGGVAWVRSDWGIAGKVS